MHGKFPSYFHEVMRVRRSQAAFSHPLVWRESFDKSVGKTNQS
jgi:hypothetical protein